MSVRIDKSLNENVFAGIPFNQFSLGFETKNIWQEKIRFSGFKIEKVFTVFQDCQSNLRRFHHQILYTVLSIRTVK